MQALIGTGFDPMMATDPYKCFVYTSFQERATKISHGNTATLAKQHGAPQLAKMCRSIAVRLSPPRPCAAHSAPLRTPLRASGGAHDPCQSPEPLQLSGCRLGHRAGIGRRGWYPSF